MNDPLFPFLDNIVPTYDGKFLLTYVNGVPYVKVWSHLYPEGEVFRYWFNLPDVGFVLLNEKHEVYLYNAILKRKNFKRKRFTYACSIYCGLKRIHWSCFWCRKRKIFKGKACNPAKIRLYFAPIFDDAKLSRARAILVTKLRSFTEFLSGV